MATIPAIINFKGNMDEKLRICNGYSVTKAEFKETIANLRAELIKWMFIFWVGQIGVLTGILFAFFK